MKKEAEEERERVREAARERVLREFERGQLGLAATSIISTSSGLEASSECEPPFEPAAAVHLMLSSNQLPRRHLHCPHRPMRSRGPCISNTFPFHTCPARGTKRKFDFDTSAVERLTRKAEEAALRQIEREQAEALKSKLPDFWLPSLAPTYTSSGPPMSPSDVKLQTTCHGGNPAHPLAYVVHA